MKYEKVERQKKIIHLLIQGKVSPIILDIIDKSIDIAYLDGRLDMREENEKNIH